MKGGDFIKIALNAGHTITGAGSGAVYPSFKESDMTRLVCRYISAELKNHNVKVINCTVDKAATRTAYLKAVCDKANESNANLFLSIHFNASENKLGNGVEVYTWKGKQHGEAVEICANISHLGFKNRGVKDGSNLYVIKNTDMKAILIEVCFLDNQTDINLFLYNGIKEITQAIANAIL